MDGLGQPRQAAAENRNAGRPIGSSEALKMASPSVKIR
jgi:hypothetical protein